MSLLGKIFGTDPPPESDEQRRRREASERRLQAGGIPLDAEERLREMAGRQGKPGHIFTSDLSVNELALAHEAGYQALGQVMGSSIYHVGFQWRNLAWQNSVQMNGGSWEYDVLTAAYYNARHLALSRLVQEAALLGATGVIGVRLERKQYDWGENLLEFAAIGTAIRETGAPFAQGKLFLSDLSGQEFWELKQAGFRPVQLVMGNCTYYQIPSWNSRQVTSGGIFNVNSWFNQELPDYTQALYTARALAMTRMEEEARAAGADGVVGADVEIEAEPHEVEVNNQTRIDMLYHFTAIGTAIVECGRSELNPQISLPLG